jgi:hypothetical protein
MRIPKNKKIEQLLLLRESLLFNGRSMIPNPTRIRAGRRRASASALWLSDKPMLHPLAPPWGRRVAPSLPPDGRRAASWMHTRTQSASTLLPTLTGRANSQLRKISNYSLAAVLPRTIANPLQAKYLAMPVRKLPVNARDIINRRSVAGSPFPTANRPDSTFSHVSSVFGVRLPQPSRSWSPPQNPRSDNDVYPRGVSDSSGLRSTPKNRFDAEDTALQPYPPAAETEIGSHGTREPTTATIHLDGAMLGRWAVDHLGRVLAKPAAGMTGVDPRAAFPRGRVAPF